MHNLTSILNDACLDCLNDLKDYYEYLSSLSIAERDRVVHESNKSLESIWAAILHEDTTKAKKHLLHFQYITLLKYNPGGFSNNRHRDDFIERLISICPDQQRLFKGWLWQAPSLSEFAELVYPNLLKVDFYKQAELLCGINYGGGFNLPFPKKADETFNSWSKYSGLLEESWSWEYENQIKEEEAKWFPSKTKIRNIERAWVSHRDKAEACLKDLEPIFPGLFASKERVSTLRYQERKLSIQCSSMNQVLDAIKNGVQLKHLLLEERYAYEKLFRNFARGLQPY